MKAVFEFGGFLALAFGAHVVVWQGSSHGPEALASEPAGETVALSGANAGLQEMVATWDSPPEVAELAPLLKPHAKVSHPEVAAFVRPAPSLPSTPAMLPLPAPPLLPEPSAEQPLSFDSTPPPPPPQPFSSPRPKPRPVEKPVIKTKTKPASKAVSQSSPKVAAKKRPKAEGSSTANKQNAGGQQTTAAASPRQMARWGGAIRASIERRKRYPAGSRAKGSVSLAITVSSTGALAGLSVAKSSGNRVLDQAALSAVKRARLPKAPAGIPAGTHRFTLSVSFAG